MPENITNTHYKTQVRTIPKQVNNSEINYKKEQYSYNTGIPVLGSKQNSNILYIRCQKILPIHIIKHK